MPSETLTCVVRVGQLHPAQVEVHVADAEPVLRAQIRHGGRAVLALADAAAQVDVGGGDDGERHDQHDHRKDEPSRPAQQAGRHQAETRGDRDDRHRDAAADRGDQADARGRAEHRDQREQHQRGARDRLRRVLPDGAAEAAVEREHDHAARRDAEEARPDEEARARQRRERDHRQDAGDHDRRHPRAALHPGGLARVRRQQQPQRDVGDQADAAHQRRRAERDAEDHRVDPEVAAEAAGDAPDVLVRRRARQLARAGYVLRTGERVLRDHLGITCGGHARKPAARRVSRPLGITLGDPDLSLPPLREMDDFGAGDGVEQLGLGGRAAGAEDAVDRDGAGRQLAPGALGVRRARA